MSRALIEMHARKTTPRYIYKAEYRPDHGTTAHRYTVHNADGQQLTSFIAESDAAKALAKADNLEAISAAGLFALDAEREAAA